MGTVIGVSAVTVAVMILGILRFPKIRLGRSEVSSYWVIVLLGALTLVALGQISPKQIGGALLADSAINPFKILILFLSMTILSIYLDEQGFFRYLADQTLRKAHASQTRLFVYLYLIVSVLTVFTSNDVIILSFTPFICYFSKNARIDPIPYLATEFVAANTWSMALIIGNPTNIYIGTAYGIGFVEYCRAMLLPTLLAGCVSFCTLYLLFRKSLREPVSGTPENVVIKDHLNFTVGLIHLAVCTVFLAVSSYIGLEMWAVSGIAVLCLFAVTLAVSMVRRSRPVALAACLRRAPWQLVPFLLSMFVITMALADKGVTSAIGNALGTDGVLLKYGIASFLGANVINNIPMSVLFCGIMEQAGTAALTKAVYATIVGSNVGAFLTPIGALAGIMWSSILNDHGLKFGYMNFLKIGVVAAIPALLAAIAGLAITL